MPTNFVPAAEFFITKPSKPASETKTLAPPPRTTNGQLLETADSMAIFSKNQQTDRLELYNSAFVTIQIDTLRYNQIKGNNLTAWFKDDEIYKIIIKGNGESIYYLLDGEELAGLNRSKSTDIEIYIDQGKVTDVIEILNPEGFIDPPEPLGRKEPRLTGFKWLDALRPKEKEDIFRK